MRKRRGGIAAATIDGRIVVAGGEEAAGTIGEVEAYEPEGRRWRYLPRLPTPRHGLGVVIVPATKALDAARNLVTTPARLLVLAGGPTPGGSQTAVCEAMDLP